MAELHPNDEITSRQQLNFIASLHGLMPFLDEHPQHSEVDLGEFDLAQPGLATEKQNFIGHFRLESGWLARIHIQETRIPDEYIDPEADAKIIAELKHATLIRESYNVRVPQPPTAGLKKDEQNRKVDLYQINRLQQRGIGHTFPRVDQKVYQKLPPLGRWYEVYGDEMDHDIHAIHDLEESGEISNEEAQARILQAHLAHQEFVDAMGEAPKDRFTVAKFEVVEAVIAMFGAHNVVKLEQLD